jgi:hypothetical protein
MPEIEPLHITQADVDREIAEAYELLEWARQHYEDVLNSENPRDVDIEYAYDILKGAHSAYNGFVSLRDEHLARLGDA